MAQHVQARGTMSRSQGFLLACSVGVLLLLIVPRSVFAHEPTFQVVEQPVVEVEVNVRSGAEARWLKSLGYDCPGCLCQLTLPAGDEELLARRGMAVRVTARAIRLTGSRDAAASAAAFFESWRTLINNTNYPIADRDLFGCGPWTESALTFTTAPAGSTVTRARFWAVIAHPRATDVEAYVGINTGITLTVWNRGASKDPINIDTGRVTKFNGSTVNRKWSLMARDCVAGQTGTIDRFEVTLYFECPYMAVPSSPAPANHETSVYRDLHLNWADSAGATSYNVYFGTTNPPPIVTNVTWSEYDPGEMEDAKTYYWKIQALNDCGAVDGPVWDFTTCGRPGSSSAVAPLDGATGIELTTSIVWTAATGATRYDWYFGTDNPPPYVSWVTATAIRIIRLDCSTRYYWVIDPRNFCGRAGSTAVWSFVTYGVPAAPGSPGPAAGATGRPVNTDLSWQQVPEAETYDVYFGTVSPPPLVGSASTNAYNLPVLSYSTRYYWKVVAKNACGSGTGPVWEFTTEPVPVIPPGPPSAPVPNDKSIGAPLNLTLDWADSPGAQSYDVYFGTEPEPSLSGTALESNLDLPLIGTTQDSSFTLPVLSCSTTYYWQIVARNAQGATAGPVWELTTCECRRAVLPLIVR